MLNHEEIIRTELYAKMRAEGCSETYAENYVKGVIEGMATCIFNYMQNVGANPEDALSLLAPDTEMASLCRKYIGRVEGLAIAVLTYVENTGAFIEASIRLLAPDKYAARMCRQCIEMRNSLSKS